jgi:hypothetical protein
LPKSSPCTQSLEMFDGYVSCTSSMPMARRIGILVVISPGVVKVVITIPVYNIAKLVS